MIISYLLRTTLGVPYRWPWKTVRHPKIKYSQNRQYSWREAVVKYFEKMRSCNINKGEEICQLLYIKWLIACTIKFFFLSKLSCNIYKPKLIKKKHKICKNLNMTNKEDHFDLVGATKFLKKIFRLRKLFPRLIEGGQWHNAPVPNNR